MPWKKISKNHKPDKILKTMCTLGENAMMENNFWQFSTKTKSRCMILSLNKRDLIGALSKVKAEC